MIIEPEDESIRFWNQRREIKDAYEVMTWRIKQIPSLGWIKVEKDTRYDQDFFLQASFKEFQAIRYGMWQGGHYLEVSTGPKPIE